MAHDVVGGRYRLEQQLSSTQMADVWLAYDLVLERRVVVKLLAPSADHVRFEREARAVAGLAHPNIVQLYDYGEERDRPYMVLEHVPGGTLSDRLPDSQHLADPETRAIATDIAAGLAYAHLHGVVHRDLKPANVLFDAEDRAKIADFGIARVQGIDTLTEAGTVLGTAAYMSPEQVAGEPATAASDVYAWGILLYRMLSGRLPFESENALELATMQRDLEARPVRSLRRQAPADLAALATGALAKDPFARPADGSALITRLQRPESATAMVTDTSDAPTRAMVAAAPLAARRVWPRLVIGGVVLAAAGIAVAVLLFGTSSSTPAVTTTPPSSGPPSTSTPGTATASGSSSTGTSTTSPTRSTKTSPSTSRTTTSSPPRPTTRPTSTAGTTAPTTATPTLTTAPSTTTPTTTAAPTTAATTTGP